MLGQYRPNNMIIIKIIKMVMAKYDDVTRCHNDVTMMMSQWCPFSKSSDIVTDNILWHHHL